MKIDLELAKHKEEIIESTEKLIKEIIDANKKKHKRHPNNLRSTPNNHTSS